MIQMDKMNNKGVETVSFSQDINEAVYHFFFKVFKRFDKDFLEKYKHAKKTTKLSWENSDDTPTGKMFDIISNEDNKEFFFKKFYFRGKGIKEKTFNGIENFINVIAPEKICIYIHRTETGFTDDEAKSLREYLPFSEENSPVAYSTLNDKKGDIVYVHLIGVNTKED